MAAGELVFLHRELESTDPVPSRPGTGGAGLTVASVSTVSHLGAFWRQCWDALRWADDADVFS